jgi:hypothetical protein
MAGDVQIPPDATIWFGQMNDSGQLLIDAFVPGQDRLFQYSEGQFTLILTPGMDGPTGPWPKDVGTISTYSINRRGNAAFVAANWSPDSPLPESWLGVFRWDATARQVLPVVLKGMTVGSNLTITQPGGAFPVINNREEIAFVAGVQNSAGPSGYGLFLAGADGKIQPVLLPNQELPDGAKAPAEEFSRDPSLTDDGRVAFMVPRVLTVPEMFSARSAYLWEKEAITPVALLGAEIPDVGKLAAVNMVLANNKNRDLLVVAGTTDVSPESPRMLFRYTGGRLAPLLRMGQEMPGGGKFQTLRYLYGPEYGVSLANDLGQHVFVARLEGGATAAYLLEADGTVSPIVKSGMTTELGTITDVGADSYPALNGKGQVALAIKADNGPFTVALLTPVTP